MELKNPAIQIKDLHFQYSTNSGVSFKDFSLDVRENDRFGLFGPNGAGKSTLMNLMTGILKAKSGSVLIFGEDIQHNSNKKVNRLFGFVPQDFSFYPELSPVENLDFFAAWYGLTRTQGRQATTELLEVLGLENVHNKPVSQFSGGMKRRINLAIGVMHKPKLLFLDEPTVGVDVQTRNAILLYLKELNNSGTTLVYTSHQLNEAESLCTNVALIDKGEIIARDTLSVLCKEYQEDGLEGLFLHLTGKEYRDR